MPKSISHESAKLQLAVGTTVVLLAISLPRRARGEDLTDFKVMYYMEDDNRIDVLSPTFQIQKDLSSSLTIKIDGIYNSISGATPTGAPITLPAAPAAASPAQPSSSSSSSSPAPTRPAPAAAPSVSYDDDDDEREEDDDDDDRRMFPGMPAPSVRLPYWAKAGATPAPTPAPAPAPVQAPAPTTTC